MFEWSCTVLQIQTFKISCLTYLASAFKISRKISRFKNFCWIHGFALHYESIESAEIWENFVLLACRRLTFLFSELKLILLRIKISKKLNQFSFLSERYEQWSSDTRTDKDFLILVALGVTHLWRPQKMVNSVTPPHPQKLTIDLFFKSDRIWKHVANLKTPPFHSYVDVINVWSLAP